MPPSIPLKPPDLRYGQTVFLANGDELTVIYYLPTTHRIMALRPNGVRTYFDVNTKTYNTKEEVPDGKKKTRKSL